MEIIEKRRNIHIQILNTRSERIQQPKEEYREIDRLVKRETREDKRDYFEKMANDAENAARHGHMNKIYAITREIKVRRMRAMNVIMNKRGEKLTKPEDIMNRC